MLIIPRTRFGGVVLGNHFLTITALFGLAHQVENQSLWVGNGITLLRNPIHRHAEKFSKCVTIRQHPTFSFNDREAPEELLRGLCRHVIVQHLKRASAVSVGKAEHRLNIPRLLSKPVEMRQQFGDPSFIDRRSSQRPIRQITSDETLRQLAA